MTESNGKKTGVLQKLGMNEAYQLAMYMLDQYRGTILTCRYQIPANLTPAESRGQLEDVVKVAVVDTMMRHPILQVGTASADTKNCSWVQLKTIDLKQHIKWLDIGANEDFERKIQETFLTLLDERFPDPASQPGWHLTILRQGNAPTMEIMLTWNHAQFDGVGAKVYHEDFLSFLNAQNEKPKSLDGDIFQLPEEPPILPKPIETVKKLPVEIRHFIQLIWEEFRPQFLNWDKTQAVWCPIRSIPYKTQYRSFYIEKEYMDTIRSLCRHNKTTITGLMNGLALIAFSLRLDSTAASAFQSSTMVDHRRNMPPPSSDAPWGPNDRIIGNYVTQLIHRYEIDLVARVRATLPSSATQEVDLSPDMLRELWAASAQSRQDILDKIELGVRNDLIGVSQYIKDWQQMMKALAKKTRIFTWLVSNMGVVNGGDAKSDDGQKWLIKRAQFGLSAEVPGAAIEYATISVAGQGMCVASNWVDCAVDVTLGDRIMADLERWLVQLGSH